jgi:hypothetical protein
VPSYAAARAYLPGNGFADFRGAAFLLKAGAKLLIGYTPRCNSVIDLRKHPKF